MDINGFWEWTIVTMCVLIIPMMMGAFCYRMYLDWKTERKTWAIRWADVVNYKYQNTEKDMAVMLDDKDGYEMMVSSDQQSPEEKSAEKIVRDSMPQVVKDVVDGKYRTDEVDLAHWIRLHKLDIDEVIKMSNPDFDPEDYDMPEERRLWVLNTESLYKWAISEGVVI